MYECNDEGTYTFCCEIENSVSDEDIYIYTTIQHLNIPFMIWGHLV